MLKIWIEEGKKKINNKIYKYFQPMSLEVLQNAI